MMAEQAGICPNCGNQVNPADTFCNQCRYPLNAPPGTHAPITSVGGDQIDVEVAGSEGVAIGRGAQAVRVGDVDGMVVQAHDLVQSSIITAGTVTIQQQAVAANSRRSSKWQVVRPAEFYVARETFEKRLSEMLVRRVGDLNVVGLYGLPGVGGSMMGRKVAIDLKDEFPDGILWVDVEDKSEIDILWMLIEPYEAPAERSPFRDSRHYLKDIQEILADKRVLIVLDQVGPKDSEVVSKVLPRGCDQVSVLIITSAPLPGLFLEENSISLPELTPAEAEQLFRKIWRGAFSATPTRVIQDLAQELGYLPPQIVLVARDIINRQIAPQDYLDELRRQRQDRQFSIVESFPGLKTVYENLPEKGKLVFPYIGVVGVSGWTLEALVTVAQLKRQDVEIGLRQLVLAGFLKGDIEGGYRCSPSVRNFALSLLRELGGDALVRTARAVLARHILRQAKDTTHLFRQSLLDDYLLDSDRQEMFSKALHEAFMPVFAPGPRSQNTIPLRSRPALGDTDVVQDVFEQVVLNDPEYFSRWTELLSSELCLRLRNHLEEALKWSIEREDWSLVRRFATLSLSAYGTDLKGKYENDVRQPVNISEFTFGPLRNCNLSNVYLDSTFQAARLIEPRLNHCEMISSCWSGVHLHRPSFNDVDMVNAYMPGLIVRDGTFIDVDARGADLRGAIFYNCYLESINFRYANLAGADFVHCRGGTIDFRNTNLRGTTLVSSIFNNVTYYQAEQSVLKPMLDSNRPTGPIRDTQW